MLLGGGRLGGREGEEGIGWGGGGVEGGPSLLVEKLC